MWDESPGSTSGAAASAEENSGLARKPSLGETKKKRPARETMRRHPSKSSPGFESLKMDLATLTGKGQAAGSPETEKNPEQVCVRMPQPTDSIRAIDPQGFELLFGAENIQLQNLVPTARRASILEVATTAHVQQGLHGANLSKMVQRETEASKIRDMRRILREPPTNRTTEMCAMLTPYLLEFPFFSDCPSQFALHLSSSVTYATYTQRKVLCQEGEKGHTLYCIMSGSVNFYSKKALEQKRKKEELELEREKDLQDKKEKEMQEKSPQRAPQRWKAARGSLVETVDRVSRKSVTQVIRDAVQNLSPSAVAKPQSKWEVLRTANVIYEGSGNVGDDIVEAPKDEDSVCKRYGQQVYEVSTKGCLGYETMIRALDVLDTTAVSNPGVEMIVIQQDDLISLMKKMRTIVHNRDRALPVLEKLPLKRTEDDLKFLVEMLKAHAFFMRLEQSLMPNLLRVMTLKRYEPGDPVCIQGQKGTKFFIILKGSLSVHVSNKSHSDMLEVAKRNKDVEVDDWPPFTSREAHRNLDYEAFGDCVKVLHAGDSLGERALLDASGTGGERQSTVIAQLHTELMVLKRKDFQQFSAQMHNVLIDMEMMLPILMKSKLLRTAKEVDILVNHSGSNPFFKSLKPEVHRQLMQVAQYEKMDPDGVVFHQGEPGEAYYIIMRGVVGIHAKPTASSKWDRSLQVRKVAVKEAALKCQYQSQHRSELENLYGPAVAVLRSGQAFGELALEQDGTLRSGTAICYETTDFVVINKSDYDDVMKRFHHDLLKEKLALLKGLSVVRSWPSSVLVKITYLMHEKSFMRHLVVVAERDPPSNVYLLCEAALPTVPPSPLSAWLHGAAAAGGIAYTDGCITSLGWLLWPVGCAVDGSRCMPHWTWLCRAADGWFVNSGSVRAVIAAQGECRQLCTKESALEAITNGWQEQQAIQEVHFNTLMAKKEAMDPKGMMGPMKRIAENMKSHRKLQDVKSPRRGMERNKMLGYLQELMRNHIKLHKVANNDRTGTQKTDSHFASAAEMRPKSKLQPLPPRNPAAANDKEDEESFQAHRHFHPGRDSASAIEVIAVGKGECIGAHATVNGTSEPFTVYTEHECRFMVINGDNFVHFFTDEELLVFSRIVSDDVAVKQEHLMCMALARDSFESTSKTRIEEIKNSKTLVRLSQLKSANIYHPHSDNGVVPSPPRDTMCQWLTVRCHPLDGEPSAAFATTPRNPPALDTEVAGIAKRLDTPLTVAQGRLLLHNNSPMPQKKDLPLLHVGAKVNLPDDPLGSVAESHERAFYETTVDTDMQGDSDDEEIDTRLLEVTKVKSEAGAFYSRKHQTFKKSKFKPHKPATSRDEDGSQTARSANEKRRTNPFSLHNSGAATSRSRRTTKDLMLAVEKGFVATVTHAGRGGATSLSTTATTTASYDGERHPFPQPLSSLMEPELEAELQLNEMRGALASASRSMQIAPSRSLLRSSRKMRAPHGRCVISVASSTTVSGATA
ncbi:hypothetical protein CYMTET_43161 [Cymbomonas tetramitiformis]|uniref:Cyclic nucleotide-binding domain-containing protein n=1 Tax=Cymbomonas tetramitiformis TaxID=36881 RepID=A0AAE0C4C7_9CHLO|nr:hypothetical protein CYMTET_43161 [Cymbomonas tetramitiformis]